MSQFFEHKWMPLVSNGYKNHSDRGVLTHSCIMGNQGKMEGNSKICIGIRS